MDNSIQVPGTRFRIGWDAIIGLFLPGAGDAVSAFSQVGLLLAAFRAGAPRIVLARMLLNVAIDALVGTVPVLGDLFDAGFKANVRNLAIVDRLEGAAPGIKRSGAKDYAFVALVIAGVLALLSLPIAVGIWIVSQLF